MNRAKSWIRSVYESNSSYTELTPVVPIIEICGQNRVLIENHRGIIGYGCREICIKVHFGFIRICGDNLKLSRMSHTKLVVTGKINGVNLHGRG